MLLRLCLMLGEEVTKRITSLRTQYLRAIKAPPSGSEGKKTVHQEWVLKTLSFLAPHVKKRESISNVDTVSLLD